MQDQSTDTFLCRDHFGSYKQQQRSACCQTQTSKDYRQCARQNYAFHRQPPAGIKADGYLDQQCVDVFDT
jgi:hypothetical protein